MSYNEVQKRNLIMEHYLKPVFKNDKINNKIIKYGESCADYLEFEVVLNNSIIQNIKFNAKGCAFFISSTDLLIKNVINKPVQEALKIINLYIDFINAKEISGKEKEQLNELIIYENVQKHHNRLYCALMLAQPLKEYLENV